MRPTLLFSLAVLGSACRGYTLADYNPCGAAVVVTDASDSPFGESPAETAARSGDFTATLAWTEPSNPLPGVWTHTADPAVQLVATDPAVACDQPKITLRGHGILSATGHEYESTLYVGWADASSTPTRVVQSAPNDRRAAEFTLDDVGGLEDWAIGVLADAGEIVAPPLFLRLQLRDDQALLIAAIDGGSGGVEVGVGLPAFTGTAVYGP